MHRVSASSFVLFLVSLGFLTLCGCGGGNPSGCPKDLSIPDSVETLGSSFDRKLFVLRLRTTKYEMDEIVELFRKKMKEDEWEVKSDSATDENGGELVFNKGDSRQCVVFITHSSESKKTINVDIKCDRETNE